LANGIIKISLKERAYADAMPTLLMLEFAGCAIELPKPFPKDLTSVNGYNFVYILVDC